MAVESLTVAPGEGASILSSLELGTKLVYPCSVRVFRSAREASWYVRAERGMPKTPGDVDPPAGGKSKAPVDRAKCDQRAARRARASVRRYCIANRLSRHLTVTYRIARDSRIQVLRDVAAFRRRLFAWSGGRFALVCVPEQGGKNKRWHAEIAMGRYVPQDVLADLWGHGFVSVHRYSDRHKTSDEVENARKVAGYLSKYVAKAFLEVERMPGEHRYEVAQGFQPDSEVFGVEDLPSGLLVAIAAFGGELPHFVWSSAQVQNFEGLPVRCGFW